MTLVTQLCELYAVVVTPERLLVDVTSRPKLSYVKLVTGAETPVAGTGNVTDETWPRAV